MELVGLTVYKYNGISRVVKGHEDYIYILLQSDTPDILANEKSNKVCMVQYREGKARRNMDRS